MWQGILTQQAELETQEMDWGRLVWLCNDKLMPGAQQTLGLCTLFPGKGNPLHYHPNCEEVLHVLSGSGRHSLGDDWFELQPGSTIRIPQNVRHHLRNTGTDDLVCVIAFSSGDRQTVFLE